MDVFEPCYEWKDAELVKASGLYPYFHTLSASEGPVVTVDGRSVVMLGSNNYLGLTHHPAVLRAAHEAIDRFGTSCTGSRFLNGNLELHETLEREIAEFTGDALAMTGMQYSLEDTLGDLYVDILGGVATSLIWVLWVWRDADGELAASAQGPLIELFGRVF